MYDRKRTLFNDTVWMTGVFSGVLSKTYQKLTNGSVMQGISTLHAQVIIVTLRSRTAYPCCARDVDRTVITMVFT